MYFIILPFVDVDVIQLISRKNQQNLEKVIERTKYYQSYFILRISLPTYFQKVFVHFRNLEVIFKKKTY